MKYSVGLWFLQQRWTTVLLVKLSPATAVMTLHSSANQSWAKDAMVEKLKPEWNNISMSAYHQKGLGGAMV